jgi:predicted helicase
MVRHPLTKKFLQSGLFKGLRSFGQLERRIEKLEADSIGATNLLRGNAFEVFAAAYLATQRSQMVKRIWPKMQLVPPTIARRLGWHSTDHGADGLVETESGDLRAYQVKFRSGRASLPWAEVSTFFGVTDRSDDRLLFTNSTSVAEITEKRRDFISIRGNDLDQLEAADFQAMLEWMRGAKLRHKKHTPRPHQRKALSDILKAFKKEDRGTVISACGTGKTFLALWAAEALGRRSVIVLVPSLAVESQHVVHG